MGSIGGMMKMVPGMSAAAGQIDDELADKQMSQIEAIILSMTPAERKDPELLDGSRRKRIAKGSGSSVEEINRMMKQFNDMRKLMKKLSKGGKGMRGMANLAQNLKHKSGLR